MVYVSATFGNNEIDGEIPEEFIDEASNAFQKVSKILQASGSSCESGNLVVIVILKQTVHIITLLYYSYESDYLHYNVQGSKSSQ